MLHHFLTGSERSRAAVHATGQLGASTWTTAASRGSAGSIGATPGLASVTRSPDFHGPGRGAGNSINALLDAHRLTGEPRYLDKADALIARCVHPDDDPATIDPLDAENRWSYTVFLQALGKYLEYRADRGLIDAQFEYARAVLLKYATWMCAQRAALSRHAGAARVSERDLGGAGHPQGRGLRVCRPPHAGRRRAREFPRARRRLRRLRDPDAVAARRPDG